MNKLIKIQDQIKNSTTKFSTTIFSKIQYVQEGRERIGGEGEGFMHEFC